MSVSKKENLYTKEQYQHARYDCSALEYAQSQGYELVRKGSYYHLKEHDSMVFTPRGCWFWNSRGLSGGALEFMMYYENKTITEAVLTLWEENAQQQTPIPQNQARGQPTAQVAPQAPAAPTAKAPKGSSPPNMGARQFVPPLKSDNYRRLFGYLCGTRGLEKSVVQDMINQRVLYESVYRPSGGGGEFHNACFLSFDSEGKPCGAFERGTNTFGSTYKGDVPGSDKSHGWLFHGGKDIHAVAVFEAAIDAASYASLCRVNNASIGANLDYLALGGLDDKALFNYLKEHPEIKDVALCLDADKWGRRATERIQEKLTGQGYSAVDLTNLPEGCKDWNEFLVRTRQEMAAQEAQPEPPAEAPEIN